jgi:hypothetical protein
VGHIEVCGWIPVLALAWVIIEYLSIGIEERAFEALSGLPFYITLAQHTITHVALLFVDSNYIIARTGILVNKKSPGD